ncbi:hypothetical protein B0T16DRAFT_409530 [Cercophora newfieldiana]|uniref:Uncharacterized protein n=1 Tax=Cercophora newfieldiana TaxID=92897 RepID=A0AA39YAQ2_9PEZI|nr:hypothetical protein B0T16DRAFT_409530 [Cercophora newfieldiana]
MKPSIVLAAFLPLAWAAPAAQPSSEEKEARAYGSYLYEGDAGKLPAYTDYGSYEDAGTYQPVIYYDNDAGEAAKYSNYGDYKDAGEAGQYSDYGDYNGAGTDGNPNGIIAYNNYGKYTGVGEDAPTGDGAPAWWSAYAGAPPSTYKDYGNYKRRVMRTEGVPVVEGEE